MNLFVALLSLNLLVAELPTFTAQTVDGRQIRGLLAGWNAEAITLQVGEQQVHFPLNELLSVAPVNPLPPVATSETVWVTLTDGSVLAAHSYSAESEAAKALTNRVGVLNLPPASVNYVRFRAVPPAQQKRWTEILSKETDQDLLVIASGDVLDYLVGIVRAVRDQEIDFEFDGDILPVRRSKVFAIRYYRPNRSEASEPLARLTDDDGSVWSLQHLALSAAEAELVGETSLGLRVTLPLDAVLRVDFAGAGLVFLSDLTPDSYRWTPFFGSAENVPSLARLYRPRMNTTFDSSPIVLDGVQYEHGLALHSRTEITYRLTESFERLQARVGIDDRLRPRGNVEFRILGDERVLYESTVSGADTTRSIDVSLKGVSTLKILADFGSDLDVGDHLILAEAKLLK